jgi:dihydrofolate synthase/folylpolyglutamate synthase
MSVAAGAGPAPLDWEAYLESLAAFGMRPGVERVSLLLEHLGRPQASFRAVHVVGTNGKSSTTRYVEALLRAHGLRSAAYLSPHISGFAERVMVLGRPVDVSALGAAVQEVRTAAERLPAALGETTQFEVLTVAAFLAMARAGVAAAGVEAGLGGRLDATNVLEAPVVVLTNIALEHTEVLGSTREAIFAEKAAVIKGGDVVLGELTGLEERADAVCAAAGARAHFLGRDVRVDGGPQEFAVETRRARYERLSVPTEAAYQVVNAALAVAATELLLGGLDVALVRKALSQTVVPGRLEVVSRRPLVLVDGGHNPQGVRALAASLAHVRRPSPRIAVVAIMRDKDAPEMLAEMLPLVDAVIYTQARNERSLSAAELAAVGERVAAEVCARPSAAEVCADAHEAVSRARRQAGASGSVLIWGSLYLLEDLRDLWTPTGLA